ncbi:HNH endonuclease [Hymenobacter sp. BT188]|nr:HNH endonuclease [Hymenobacter sp. BT188]
MKPNIQTKGYRQVELYLDKGKPSRLLVHRLVAERFLSLIAGKDQVNHKDGNQLNNHVSNLEWVTNRENYRHARELRFARTRQQRFPFWK